MVPDLSLRARAVIVDDAGRVLLDRTAHAWKAPHYWLPGGGVEPGETTAEALARELFEEACLEVEVGRVLYVSENLYVESGDYRHELILYRLARVLATAAGEPVDRRGLAWWRLEELDGPLLPADVARELQRDLAEGFRRPVLHLVTDARPAGAAAGA